MSNRILIPIKRIEKVIYLIRGERVMLDRDLAKLYDVTTAPLNQAVRRNRDRFPEDFISVDVRRGGPIEPITKCDRFRKSIATLVFRRSQSKLSGVLVDPSKSLPKLKSA